MAERLHFGRAAKDLYVAQSVLSRQIHKLEQELGVELLVRSSRQVVLTQPGRQLLAEARQLLAAADAASRRVRRAAQEERTLSVGFFVGDPISRVVREFSTACPDVTVDAIRIYWSDQTDVLLDGRVDIAFLHLPIDEEGLTLTHLYCSPRLALLPADHPLAGRQELSITELADDPVVRHRGASPRWEAWHNTDPRPDGRSPPAGPLVSNLEEKLEKVATGKGISFLPASVAAAVTIAPELVGIPVVDIPPTDVCLGWQAERESDLIQTFLETAQSVVVG